MAEKLDKVILDCIKAKNFTDKYNYNEASWDNSVLRITNKKFDAIAHFIGSYCNKNEKVSLKETFNNSNNQIMKVFTKKFDECF